MYRYNLASFYQFFFCIFLRIFFYSINDDWCWKLFNNILYKTEKEKKCCLLMKTGWKNWKWFSGDSSLRSEPFIVTCWCFDIWTTDFILTCRKVILGYKIHYYSNFMYWRQSRNYLKGMYIYIFLVNKLLSIK